LSAPNALPEVLERLALPREGRVLDIGGAAYLGNESTQWLVDAFAARVDVVYGKPEQREAMEQRFGERIRLLAGEAEAEEGAYDLVVASPVLARLMDWLTEADWRAGRLLKPGGALVTFGIDPAALGAPGHKQPEDEVRDAFLAAFGGGDGGSVHLPSWLGQWSLVENVPRKPAFRSYLSWLVLRRNAQAAPGSLADGLAGTGDDLARVLEGAEFDTLMVFEPSRFADRRAQRTAAALASFGRRLLWVETRGDALSLVDGPTAGRLLRFPDASQEIERRIKLVGGDPHAGRQAELARRILAERLAGLVRSRAGPLAIHSQGADAGRVVAATLDLASRVDAGQAARVGWVHDRLDPRLDPGVMPRVPSPDIVVVPTDNRASGTGKTTGILDVQALADRFTWRSESLRQKLEIEGKILVYSGPGEGADLSRLAKVLAQDVSVHLVVLAGRTGNAVKALRRAARELGADARLRLMAAPRPTDIPGLIADADLGIIAVDSSGGPERAEIERFSDYLTAGVPVLAPTGGAVAALLEAWPVGVAYDPDDGLATAVAEALNRRSALAAAIHTRPDLQLDYAWETQAARLRHIYRRLAKRPAKTRAA
jgi:hypothetical protein